MIHAKPPFLKFNRDDWENAFVRGQNCPCVRHRWTKDATRKTFCRPLFHFHRDHAENFCLAALEQATQRRERLPIEETISPQSSAE